jgi:hypothetical protein
MSIKSLATGKYLQFLSPNRAIRTNKNAMLTSKESISKSQSSVVLTFFCKPKLVYNMLYTNRKLQRSLACTYTMSWNNSHLAALR